MANKVEVSQLVSTITLLKSYLEASILQCNELREVNNKKDSQIREMQVKIVTLENEILDQNSEISELKNFLENSSNYSYSEQRIIRTAASSEDLKKCQTEMIMILKERCDDLNSQLLATRQACNEKCELIKKYRDELSDVGGQIATVHQKLSDMKEWQKKMELYYGSLRENLENNQIAASDEHNRIHSEITDLKRVQNEFLMIDDVKETAMLNGTGDGISNDDKTKIFPICEDQRNKLINRFEIISNLTRLKQLEIMPTTAIVSPASIGGFFNLNAISAVKNKFDYAVHRLTGCDKKSKNHSLIKYGIPATIICCFVTGTLLTQMVFKFPAGNRLFTISQADGSSNFVISSPIIP